MKGICTIQTCYSRHKQIPALNQADLHLINTMAKCFRGRCSKLTLTYCLFLVLLKAATKFSSVHATNEGKQSTFASQDFLIFPVVCKQENKLYLLNQPLSTAFSTYRECVSKHIFFQHNQEEQKSPNPLQEYEKYLQNTNQNSLITHTNANSFERAWSNKTVLKY